MRVKFGFLILLFSLVLFPVSAFASTWAKTYGGDAHDVANSIQQTSDGGFIVAGYTGYVDIGGEGDFDYQVLKLNANGNVTWSKTYGGSWYENAKSIQQILDGGYIVAGYKSVSEGGSGFWMLKLAANGNVTWQKTYGGTPTTKSEANSIQQTSDGGFIVAGQTNWSTAGNYYIWVLKLDANGNVTWHKRIYGGFEDNYAQGSGSF